MNTFDYIDEEIEKKFLELKEQFLGEMVHMQEQMNNLGKGSIETLQAVQDISELLKQRIDGTNQLIVDILKKGKEMIESL